MLFIAIMLLSFPYPRETWLFPFRVPQMRITAADTYSSYSAPLPENPCRIGYIPVKIRHFDLNLLYTLKIMGSIIGIKV